MPNWVYETKTRQLRGGGANLYLAVERRASKTASFLKKKRKGSTVKKQKETGEDVRGEEIMTGCF